MRYKWYITVTGFCFIFLIGLSGCAKKSVRHLASDVCLVTPEVSTKDQVLTYLGQPDEQDENAEGGETWYYYEVKKSFLNKTPYIGDTIGDRHYETVTVTFVGDIVRTCVYRSVSPEEFQKERMVQ